MNIFRFIGAVSPDAAKPQTLPSEVEARFREIPILVSYVVGLRIIHVCKNCP
jgi:hypothetical protein